MQRQSLFEQTSAQLVHLQACDGTGLFLPQRVKNHYLIDAAEKFWTECLAQPFQLALALHLFCRPLDTCAVPTWHRAPPLMGTTTCCYNQVGAYSVGG